MCTNGMKGLLCSECLSCSAFVFSGGKKRLLYETALQLLSWRRQNSMEPLRSLRLRAIAELHSYITSELQKNVQKDFSAKRQLFFSCHVPELSPRANLERKMLRSVRWCCYELQSNCKCCCAFFRGR